MAEDVPKPVQPTAKVCRSISSCGTIGSCSKSVGEEDPDAEPLKAALKQARIHARVRPVGERLDLCLQCIARVKKQWHEQRNRSETPGKSRGRWRRVADLEVLRGEASQQPRTHQDPSAPSRR